jgi:hypothetical protein
VRNAIAAGVRTFSVESPTDLERVGRVASQAGAVIDCLLRINSQSTQAATSIRMTGVPSQFGFDSETLSERLPELRAVPGTRLIGAHLYSQSNARDEASLIAELQHSVAVAGWLHGELGLPTRFLDLGGGFGCPYAVPGERVVYEKLRPGLETALDLHFPRWRAGGPQIACESTCSCRRPTCSSQTAASAAPSRHSRPRAGHRGRPPRGQARRRRARRPPRPRHRPADHDATARRGGGGGPVGARGHPDAR